MNPAWIALGIAAGGAFAFFVMTPLEKATEQPPAGRHWAIERCHGDRCELLAWRYSGPTACNVDIKSERIGKQMPAGVRLVCILDKEVKR